MRSVSYTIVQSCRLVFTNLAMRIPLSFVMDLARPSSYRTSLILILGKSSPITDCRLVASPTRTCPRGIFISVTGFKITANENLPNFCQPPASSRPSRFQADRHSLLFKGCPMKGDSQGSWPGRQAVRGDTIRPNAISHCPEYELPRHVNTRNRVALPRTPSFSAVFKAGFPLILAFSSEHRSSFSFVATPCTYS